jgi:hypothetical protein
MIVHFQTQMKAVIMILMSKKKNDALMLVVDNKSGVGDTA